MLQSVDILLLCELHLKLTLLTSLSSVSDTVQMSAKQPGLFLQVNTSQLTQERYH